MCCRLCLNSTEILIPIYDEEGKDSKAIASAIAKYLNMEFTLNDREMLKICISCWSNLDNFQKFCRFIQDKQIQMKEMTKLEITRHEEIHEPINDGTLVKQQEILMGQELNEDINTDRTKDMVSNAQNICEKEMLVNMPHSDEVNKTVIACKRKIEKSDIESPATVGSNKRKIGRPCKKDIDAYQNEDRLIASHMLLICNLCQAEQNTFYELKQHFRQEHQSEGYAVCCNKKLYKKGLLVEHIHVHNNPDYFKCEHCGLVFADRVCLRNHTLLKHNQESEQKFACNSCPRKFAKLYFLQRHELRHATVDEKHFQCSQCNKGYPSLSRLKGHLRNVHGDGGLNVCSHCGAQVRGTAAFQKHMRQHEGIVERGVQCEVCGQWLSDKYVLRLHMERHGEQKTYVCDICGKEAPSRTAINSHYRYHHINAEPTHKCGVCGKAFKTPRSLREHIATHTGEFLYTCTYCPKTFKCSSNLHSHRKWQHPVEWANEKQIPKKCVDT